MISQVYPYVKTHQIVHFKYVQVNCTSIVYLSNAVKTIHIPTGPAGSLTPCYRNKSSSTLRGQQLFSVKGQMINVFGFVVHMVSMVLLNPARVAGKQPWLLRKPVSIAMLQ